MCQSGAVVTLPFGIQLGSALAPESRVVVLVVSTWTVVHSLVSCFNLWPSPCMGVAQRAGAIGFGACCLVGLAFDVGEGENASSVGAGWLGLATDTSQQRIGQRLLFLDPAKLGTRTIYSFPWPDSMAWLALALCFAGLFDASFVFSSPH